MEILRGGPVTSKYIMENRLGDLSDYIATREIGMQRFDQHLIDLYNQKVISGTEAMRLATNPEAVALGMRGSTDTLVAPGDATDATSRVAREPMDPRDGDRLDPHRAGDLDGPAGTPRSMAGRGGIGEPRHPAVDPPDLVRRPTRPHDPGRIPDPLPASELFILIALLASLGILMFLLAAQVRHRRTWAWLTRSIPRLRLLRIGMRVGTTMILIAILGLDLGWEIVAWRNWRLRERYLGLASSYRTSEAANRDSLHRAEIQIARLDADSSMGPEEASWTPAAQAAVRAFSRDIWHRNAAIATGQAAHYADLKQKYERAAADPSRPVPPDPPPPDEPQPHLQGIFIWPGKYDQALADCDEIIRRYSDLPWVHRERAWILATCPDARIRDGKLAVAAATRAAELTNWKDWTVFPSLAAAYAEAGDFANAVRWEQAPWRPSKSS